MDRGAVAGPDGLEPSITAIKTRWLIQFAYGPMVPPGGVEPPLAD